MLPIGFWPWDLPRHFIHHDTSSAFSNNVPLYNVLSLVHLLTSLTVQAVPYSRDYKRKYEYLKQQLKKPSNVPNKIEIKVCCR